jgi:hypothetical protein
MIVGLIDPGVLGVSAMTGGRTELGSPTGAEVWFVVGEATTSAAIRKDEPLWR